MTSNELINELRRLDPGPVAELSWWDRLKLAFRFAKGENCLHLAEGGNTPVCFSNCAILCVRKEPAYYDGDLMIANKELNKIRFEDQGEKIVIDIVTLDDMVDRTKGNLQVEYSSERSQRNNAGKVQSAKLLYSDFDF